MEFFHSQTRTLMIHKFFYSRAINVFKSLDPDSEKKEARTPLQGKCWQVVSIGVFNANRLEWEAITFR